MLQLLWDASAFVKRYFAETGTATVDALLDQASVAVHFSTTIGYAETGSILRRKHNGGEISRENFLLARDELEKDVLRDALVSLLSINDERIFEGIPFADRHNINSTDGAILAAFLEYARSQTPSDPPCVLVATDRHLLRAATAEGLLTLNPHLVSVADLPTFLAQLS